MGDDYVDYTLLKKKGILKLKEEKLRSSLRSEGGFVDLTPFRNETTIEPSLSSAMPPMGNFGFLSDMASVGSSSPSVSPTTSSGEEDLSSLRIKIDDMEYKLERFIERIDKLEEKMTKAED